MICGDDYESIEDDGSDSSSDDEKRQRQSLATLNAMNHVGMENQVPSKRSKDTSGQDREASSMRKDVPLIKRKKGTIKKRKVGNKAIPQWQFFTPTSYSKRSSKAGTDCGILQCASK